jgi:hypothetical protein
VPVNRKENHQMKADEKKAIQYARWLAERDAMPLPEHADTAIEWAEPMMRSGIRLARIKAVTVYLPGWDYDPTPMKGPPAGEP